MSRRFSLAVAITAIATWVLVPGMAAAQTTASPAAVLPAVIERPAQPAPQVLGETLPRTGSNLTPMIIMAVALLVLGVFLVMSVRRRQSDVTPA